MGNGLGRGDGKGDDEESKRAEGLLLVVVMGRGLLPETEASGEAASTLDKESASLATVSKLPSFKPWQRLFLNFALIADIPPFLGDTFSSDPCWSVGFCCSSVDVDSGLTKEGGTL
jgi:hypothetical protein